ncbi:ATP-dependent DNA ligase [Bradyrhizobium sp. i1.3.1]
MAFQRKRPEALGVKAPLPGFVVPALASAIDRVPAGDRWIHEIKFDGYRVQVHLANKAVRVFTRRGHDWTSRFKKVAADAWHIKVSSEVIDGEVVVPSVDGSTDFSVLQNELKGHFDEDSPGRRRPALSQRPRHSDGAAVSTQGGAEKDYRRQRRPVQRELRDRWAGDIRARLQGRP